MMRNRMLMAAPIVALALAGCGGGWNVDRRDPQTIEDLHYRFTEDDARQIARTMIDDALNRPWIMNWLQESGGRRPLIVVGNVQNRTGDYIDAGLFTDPIQRELLNSGKVRVKAQKDLRQELRDERLDTEFNDPETVKAIAKEVNADFMLVGNIRSSTQKSPNQKQVIQYYQTTLELINVETAEKVWIATDEIEKRARRR